MGLDNGIVLRITDREKFGELPAWFLKDTFQYSDNSYEVNYWRKCWNVRQFALDLFGDLYNEETCEVEMTLELLNLFNKEIKTLYNRRAWDRGGSIWSWNECRGNRIDGLKFAKRVAKMLEDKPADSYSLVFYDSY